MEKHLEMFVHAGVLNVEHDEKRIHVTQSLQLLRHLQDVLGVSSISVSQPWKEDSRLTKNKNIMKRKMCQIKKDPTKYHISRPKIGDKKWSEHCFLS